MKKRILCVEDELDLLDLLCRFLESIGYEVSGAEHGLAALELAKYDQPFDLILCDLRMPKMDGLELLRHLRHDVRYMVTPFIFMTAFSQKEYMIEARKLGCDEYVVKPVDLEVLQAMVASRLSRTEITSHFYNRPHYAFQQLLLKALADEMMDPVNAIVTCTNMESQPREEIIAGEEIPSLQPMRNIYRSAVEQLSMLQQLVQLLSGGHQAHALLARECRSFDFEKILQRELRLQKIHSAIDLEIEPELWLHIDPHTLAKAVCAVFSRLTTVVSVMKPRCHLSVNFDGRAQILLDGMSIEDNYSSIETHVLNTYVDFLPHQYALKGYIIASLYLFDITTAHGGVLEMTLSDDMLSRFTITLPASRVKPVKKIA